MSRFDARNGHTRANSGRFCLILKFSLKNSTLHPRRVLGNFSLLHLFLHERFRQRRPNTIQVEYYRHALASARDHDEHCRLALRTCTITLSSSSLLSLSIYQLLQCCSVQWRLLREITDETRKLFSRDAEVGKQGHQMLSRSSSSTQVQSCLAYCNFPDGGTSNLNSLKVHFMFNFQCFIDKQLPSFTESCHFQSSPDFSLDHFADARQ